MRAAAQPGVLHACDVAAGRNENDTKRTTPPAALCRPSLDRLDSTDKRLRTGHGSLFSFLFFAKNVGTLKLEPIGM
jgi:hypothetical protein